MHLIFDTETSGKADFKKPASDSCQPHIVQLALQVADDDNVTRGEFSCLIKPEGWTIEPDAERIHGITLEQCDRFGIPIKVAMAMFSNFARVSTVAVAFNDEFDVKLIEAEFHRIERQSPFFYNNLKRFCAMKAMTPICKLKPKFPGQEFKWPSLDEAHRHFFNEGVNKAHDAMGDVFACRRIYFHLRSLP